MAERRACFEKQGAFGIAKTAASFSISASDKQASDLISSLVSDAKQMVNLTIGVF